MKLKIITYNILADYLNSPDFILVDKKYLDNEYRIKLLLKQIDSVIENNSILFIDSKKSHAEITFLLKLTTRILFQILNPARSY